MSDEADNANPDGAPRTIFRPSPLQGLAKGAEAGAAATAAARPAGGAAALRVDDVPQPGTPQVFRNWLVSEVGPTLALLASVRSGRARIPLPQLHRQASTAVEAYQKAIAPHFPEAVCANAKFGLCATIDDVAENLPGAGNDAAEWAKRSMVATYCGEQTDEDRFFKVCDDMIARPEASRDMIELYHACLAAGYEGKFREQPEGREAIQDYMKGLHDGLEHPRSVSAIQLVRQWKGQNAPMQRVALYNYVALALVIAVGVLFLVYAGLSVVYAPSLATPAPAAATQPQSK
jgi:type IV/VI secretion system ImpK/VasF family protein